MFYNKFQLSLIFFLLNFLFLDDFSWNYFQLYENNPLTYFSSCIIGSDCIIFTLNKYNYVKTIHTLKNDYLWSLRPIFPSLRWSTKLTEAGYSTYQVRKTTFRNSKSSTLAHLCNLKSQQGTHLLRTSGDSAEVFSRLKKLRSLNLSS